MLWSHAGIETKLAGRMSGLNAGESVLIWEVAVAVLVDAARKF